MGILNKLSKFYSDQKNKKNKINELTKALEYGDVSVRADAAVALAKLGDKRGINYLMNVLEKRLGSREFFLKIQEELKALQIRYLYNNVPHPVIMGETSQVAKKHLSEFNSLSMEEKAEFCQILKDWLNFEMVEADLSNALEPFALFDLALQFSVNLPIEIFIDVLVQYTDSFLTTGKNLIRPHTPMMDGVVKSIINNLTNIESQLDANEPVNQDLLEWIDNKRDELKLVAY